MLSTIRNSAAAVAALGALRLGGAAIAGAVDNTRSSSGRQRVADAPGPCAARGAQHGGRGEGQGRRARQGAQRDGAAHRVRRPVRIAIPRPHQGLERRAEGRARELLVRGHGGPGRPGPVLQAPRRPPHPPRGRGAGETALTGDTKDKVEAAVLAEYAGATIVRTETNNDATAPYEAHIRTSAGKELEVLVSKAFEVVDAREHPAHR